MLAKRERNAQILSTQRGTTQVNAMDETKPTIEAPKETPKEAPKEAPKEGPKPIYATDLESLEKVCVVEFVRGTGPGGQHKNKRYTGIRLTHPPTGVTVMATERRSQLRNRELAFERLAERLALLNHRPLTRKKTRTPRSVIARRLEGKKRRATTKTLRQSPPREG